MNLLPAIASCLYLSDADWAARTADMDLDGFSSVRAGGDDCNDDDPAVNPAAEEVCGDGIDNDCAGDGASCRLPRELYLGEATARIDGAPGELLGNTSSLPGDVDGDGVGDLAVTSPYRGGTDAGAVLLFTGPVRGELSEADAHTILLGEADGDLAGASHARVGDVDGDGRADLAYAAWWSSERVATGGAVYLFYDPPRGLVSFGSADARILGDAVDDQVGSTLLGPGDFDGDGFADIVIGIPRRDRSGDEDVGEVCVFAGPLTGDLGLDQARGCVAGSRAHDFLGTTAAPGDADGDGAPDLWVAASGASRGGRDLLGVVWFVPGPVLGPVDTDDLAVVVEGEEAGDLFGYRAAAVGDIDGDGLGDVSISSPTSARTMDQGGAIYLFLGGQWPASGRAADAPRIFTVDEPGATLLGMSSGDLDGDGRPDLCASTSHDEDEKVSAGGAVVFWGPLLDGSDATVIQGEAPGDHTGWSLDCGADTNADGIDDLLVSGWGVDHGGAEAGAAYLVLGRGE